MTKQQLLDRVFKYGDDYIIDNVVEDATNELVRYNMTLDNVYALLVYKKDYGIELSMMTKPNYDLNRILLKKKV